MPNLLPELVQPCVVPITKMPIPIRIDVMLLIVFSDVLLIVVILVPVVIVVNSSIRNVVLRKLLTKKLHDYQKAPHRGKHWHQMCALITAIPCCRWLWSIGEDGARS